MKKFCKKAFFSTESFAKPNITDLSYYSHLTQRGVISIEGKDSFSILQGISTNNLNIFSQEKERIALHTLFLNTSGRIVCDTNIIRPLILTPIGKQIKENEFWIDIQKSQIPMFLKHLQIYSLRKKVEINDISDQMKIYSFNNPFRYHGNEKEGKQVNIFGEENDVNTNIDQSGEETYTQSAFVDPRCSHLGMRVIMNKEDEFEIEGAKETLISIEEKQYMKFRNLYGIYEGEEVYDILPFQANFDLLKSISFNKGCYLGQELMSRTFHKGVIKKRMLPFFVGKEEFSLKNKINMNLDFSIIDYKFKENLKEKTISFQNEKEIIGKTLYNHNNIGTGLFNYMSLLNFENDSFKPIDDLKLENYETHIIWNEWLFTKLEEYLKKLKSKNLI